MIAMILVRALRKDIAKYNDPSAIEEAKEETGWKLVHGDVFRAPQTSPMLLSVFVGTGVQLFNMVSTSLVLVERLCRRNGASIYCLYSLLLYPLLLPSTTVL